MLEGKVIIVTGGEGLLGKAMIEDIRNKNGIAINADVLVNTDLENFNIKMDITSEMSIKEGIDLVYNHFKKIDGIVNSAYPRTKDWGAKLEDLTVESWKTNVDMQMNSVFVTTKYVLPYLKESKGSIVNIASIYGMLGNDFTVYENTKLGGAAPYNAIKGGIINFTRFLASYLGKDKVRVNTVSPGGVFDNQDPVFVKQYEHKVPLGRMANADDIAPAVSFLLSKEAKYITGQNLAVDGGWTIV